MEVLMIEKIGSVIFNQDEIIISGFCFKDINYIEAINEVLEWINKKTIIIQ
jgi:hypothetical protein